VAETIAPESGATAAPKGLLARAVGVVLSPRATYTDVAARPKWLGVLVLVVAVSGGAVTAFLSTEVGRRAAIDRQITQLESIGRPPSQAQLDRLEVMAPYFAYFALASQAIGLMLGTVVVSGVLFGVFSALLGGDATFKQFFAVVAHSGCILALQQLFVLPLDYVNKSLTSPTNLAVFLPMLDENSFFARTLGAIDLFLVWWMVNLAIGVAVLSRRPTASVATGLLAVYAVIALVIAAVKSALAGV
jgi:hypothetical protein